METPTFGGWVMAAAGGDIATSEYAGNVGLERQRRAG